MLCHWGVQRPKGESFRNQILRPESLGQGSRDPHGNQKRLGWVYEVPCPFNRFEGKRRGDRPVRGLGVEQAHDEVVLQFRSRSCSLRDPSQMVVILTTPQRSYPQRSPPRPGCPSRDIRFEKSRTGRDTWDGAKEIPPTCGEKKEESTALQNPKDTLNLRRAGKMRSTVEGRCLKFRPGLFFLFRQPKKTCLTLIKGFPLVGNIPYQSGL